MPKRVFKLKADEKPAKGWSHITKWPFIIHYTFLGEQDKMEVFHFSPNLAKASFKYKWPHYNFIKITAGTHEPIHYKVPDGETDSEDFILNLTLVNIIKTNSEKND